MSSNADCPHLGSAGGERRSLEVLSSAHAPPGSSLETRRGKTLLRDCTLAEGYI